MRMAAASDCPPVGAGCRTVRLKIACAPLVVRTCTCAVPTDPPSATLAETTPFMSEVDTTLLSTTDCATTGCQVTETPGSGFPAVSSTLAERVEGKRAPGSPA